MLCQWLILAAVCGQTTQPADAKRPVPLSASSAPTSRPATSADVESVRMSDEPAAVLSQVDQLSGDPVEIEVTADGQIMIIANEQDQKILSEVIASMDQPGIETDFRIFPLRHAQANDLAKNIGKFWNDLKKPQKGTIRPQDKITITAEPRANVLMVGGTREALDDVDRIVTTLDVPIPAESFEMHSVVLEHRKAAEAAEILRQMLEARKKKLGITQDLFEIYADAPTNALFISASLEDIEVIQNLIDVIDVEPSEAGGGIAKVAVIPLHKAVAKDLSDALNDMLKSESDVTKAMQEQIRRMMIEYRDADGKLKELSAIDLQKPIKVFPEPGTNAIIIASVESNLRPIEELVKLLDNVPLADEMLIRIFPLDHADADQLKASLGEIFDQGSHLAEIPGRSIKSAQPPGIPGSLVYSIGLVADKRTNTLIVSGRPEQLLLVQQVIEAVDVKEHANMFKPRMIKLEYAAVSTVADVVNKLAEHRQKMADEVGDISAKREQPLILENHRSNTLIVIARDDVYAEIEHLAKELDHPQDSYLGQIHIINLENLNAGDIADKIDTLWERRLQMIQLDGDKLEDKPVIVTDARSNSLVIACNLDDYNVISELIQRLEQQKLNPMADIRQIILHHNSAEKLSGLIQSIFDKRLEQGMTKGQEEQPSDRVTVVDDPMTNMLLVVSSKSNYDEIVRLVAKLDVPPSFDSLFKIFYVKHAQVTDMAEKIEKLFSEGFYYPGARELPESETKVTIIPDIRSSGLIVSASPQNFLIIERLLQELDRVDMPILPAYAKFFKLEHADVVNVASISEQLFEGTKAVLDDEQDQLEVMLIPDIKNNTLIVAGTQYAIHRAAELVPELDKPSDGATSDVKVYALQQASASRIADVMTELFDKRADSKTAGDRTPINIIADDGSNSLIVTASQDDHTIVDDLLAKLDKKSSIAEQMEIVPLVKAKAAMVADALEELIQQTEGDQEVVFAVTPNERTNSLIVFAAPSLMSNIREIIHKLDEDRPIRPMALRVYRLENQDAEDFGELLDKFFEAAGAGNEDDARTLIINFKHMDPDTGVEIARSMVHEDITITPDPTTNALVVLAPEANIDMLGQLIKMLDSVEPQVVSIVWVLLQNADAKEMKDLLDELFDTQGDTGRPRLVFGADGAPAGDGGGPAGAGEGGSAIQLAFSVDRRTNTLIAAGSPAYLKMVERLVLQLDYEEIEDRIVRVVPINHLEAEELATSLDSYFASEKSIVESVEGEEAAVRQIQREVTVQAGTKDANVLLLTYSPRMEGRVLGLINELDQPPPQVMIQVLIAEITLSDNFELGMEFALQDLLFSETSFTGPNGTLQGDNFDFIFGTDLGATGSGLGGISFTITGEDFSFLLRALQTEGRLEVISRPSIMVQDKQEANITVGERVPVVTDVVVSTGGVVTPSVNYEEVGIILDVTPIINPDGYVSLEIAPEISAIGASSVTISSGVSLPTFTERSASTTVTVKDSETIIIGGLITSRERESENKVPVFGDIPILGLLGRSTIRESTKTELLMILTPHVIRTIEDGHKIAVQMRDSSGLMDNIRRNPLMQSLQVRPEDDQFGPVEQLRPLNEIGPSEEKGDEMGPLLEEFGPAADSIRAHPGRDAVAVRAD